MKILIVFMFIGISLLSFFNCRNSAIGMINQLGFVDRFYPKSYVKTSKILKRLFKIKQSQIPQYLCVELWMSLVFVSLGPVNSLLYFIFKGSNTFLKIAFMFHLCLIITNAFVFVVISLLFKRRG